MKVYKSKLYQCWKTLWIEFIPLLLANKHHKQLSAYFLLYQLQNFAMADLILKLLVQMENILAYF